jgi:hypothetical protein
MTFFHGTSTVLGTGVVLVPGDRIGQQNWGGTDASVVWLHDNAEAARRYGEHVYRVDPIGWVENFSEQAGHIEQGLPASEWEYITQSARIVGEESHP